LTSKVGSVCGKQITVAENYNCQKYLPGSIPSVFGASKMGARIVTFLIVTFLQSYG
jgi:hypothetical protein